MSEAVVAEILGAVDPAKVFVGALIPEKYLHDEALGVSPQRPLCVVLAKSDSDVSAVLRLALEANVPVVPRGSGTGLAGGATPIEGSIVLSTELMNSILEIDQENYTATVEAGVTLEQLDDALRGLGFVYPVFPGELGSTLGGNVATNAGGMRAVKYGVTRHQVLGVEFVLMGGTLVKSGGKYVKSSSGYDLTQLVIGSEGTLGVVTKVTVRIYPRPKHAVSLLVPFVTPAELTACVPELINSENLPLVLEYMDANGLYAMAKRVKMDLGIPADVRESAQAYLLVVLEGSHWDDLTDQRENLAQILSSRGAIECYFLTTKQGEDLLLARESAFWVSKAAGANDIVDAVVPRSEIAAFLEVVKNLAQSTNSYISGAGHIGDGNVHFSIFQPDLELLNEVQEEIFRYVVSIGGAVSAEHGIGIAKRNHFYETEDSDKLEIMGRIKLAFDPKWLLNPGKMLK
ncbi:MAG: FAD-binding oxidoreductase [Acidimicrobiaceae bacterium]|nr:FAD-binding oxidoreductase [Acidimicrobiaceae bacterium]